MASTETLTFQDTFGHLATGLAYIDLRIRWAVTRARVHGLNPDDEFRGLYISDDQVDALLGQELGASLWPSPNGQMPELVQWPLAIEKARQAWLETVFADGAPKRPFQQLAHAFQLSPNELDILLLALATELDPRYERLYAYLQDDITKKRPSINLLLDILTDKFQEKLQLRKLFSKESPLIAEKLLICDAEAGQSEPTLLSQFVRPAPPIVAFLLGQTMLDDALHDMAAFVDTAVSQDEATIAHLPIGSLLRIWPETPLVGVTGAYGAGAFALAHQMSHLTGQPLLHVRAAALAQSELGLAEGMRLVLRNGRLHQATLFIDQWDSLLHESRPKEAIFKQLLAYPHPIIVAGKQPWQPRYRTAPRRLVQLTLTIPQPEQRLRIWQQQFAQTSSTPTELDFQAVAHHFRFTPGQIRDAVNTAIDLALWREEAVTLDHLLLASRTHSNQKLSTLATKITPRYGWDDIVLPADTLAQLHEMVNTIEQQVTVYNQWGFGHKLAVGKGLKALFAGEPGTGKTMSADILAHELGLDLYKIDLSTVVDKYIGETEKNIGRIFDEAATSNAILFFDEADSLFSKRSEVKDSHDRNANIQTGYLLQRMEAFDGVVILATNLRSNIDEAFTRRLHFVVEFPFPELDDRERIWRVTFPEKTPLADIDFHLLAQRFRLAGGNIRNIVLAAAFLAAKDGSTVQMHHILHAARREYQKMGRLIKEALFT